MMKIRNMVLVGGVLLFAAAQIPTLNNRQKEEIKTRKHIVKNKIKSYKVYRITSEDQELEDGLLTQECIYNKDGSVKEFTDHSNPQGEVTTFYSYGPDGQVTNEVTRHNNTVIQTITYVYGTDRWLQKMTISAEQSKEFEYLYNEKGQVQEEVSYIQMGGDSYDGNQWRAQDNIVYTYDEQGRNIKTEYYFFKELKQKSYNMFNDAGFITKTSVYDKDDEIIGESMFEYDKNNNLILAIHISPDGNNLYLKYDYQYLEEEK